MTLLKGDIIQDYKRFSLSCEELEKNSLSNLYEIIGKGEDSNNKEYMIYQRLSDKLIIVEDLAEFNIKLTHKNYLGKKHSYFELANISRNYHKIFSRYLNKFCAVKLQNDILYVRIIEVKENSNYFKGEVDNKLKSIPYDKFIGFCDEPTIECSTPEIKPFNFFKSLNIVNFNDYLNELSSKLETKQVQVSDIRFLILDGIDKFNVENNFNEFIIPDNLKKYI